MTHDESVKSIIDLMTDLFHMSEKLEGSEILDEPLTGIKLGLNDVSLVYLFFEIQKRFHIRIPPENLVSYRFNTINGIANVLMSAYT